MAEQSVKLMPKVGPIEKVVTNTTSISKAKTPEKQPIQEQVIKETIFIEDYSPSEKKIQNSKEQNLQEKESITPVVKKESQKLEKIQLEENPDSLFVEISKVKDPSPISVDKKQEKPILHSANGHSVISSKGSSVVFTNNSSTITVNRGGKSIITSKGKTLVY